eukprot:357877-Chlamydomonas_euryale.AAC.9
MSVMGCTALPEGVPPCLRVYHLACGCRHETKPGLLAGHVSAAHAAVVGCPCSFQGPCRQASTAEWAGQPVHAGKVWHRRVDRGAAYVYSHCHDEDLRDLVPVHHDRLAGVDVRHGHTLARHHQLGLVVHILHPSHLKATLVMKSHLQVTLEVQDA